MIAPVSGFAPTYATSSAPSESDISDFARFRNSPVSTTVIGVVAMYPSDTQIAYWQTRAGDQREVTRL